MANFNITTTDGGFVTEDYVSAKNHKDAFMKVYQCIEPAKLKYNPENNLYYYKAGNTFLVEIKSYN